MKKILMIVGSFRKDSFNLQLAKLTEEMLSGKAEVGILEYADVPFMNQDIEHPTPEGVAEARAAVLEADGIWVFTPEYNYQIPGVLKNLLDWLSRPLVPGDWERGSALKGKPVTISGVAGKSAAAGARKNLSDLLEILSMKLIAGTGTGVSLDEAAFQTGTVTLSEEVKASLQNQAEEFLAAI